MGDDCLGGLRVRVVESFECLFTKSVDGAVHLVFVVPFQRNLNIFFPVSSTEIT